MCNLTQPQKRMLADVKASGSKTYNGRARRTVQALKNAGLVNVEYDVVLHGIGSATETFTVTPREQK